jgi:hypothetical protein
VLTLFLLAGGSILPHLFSVYDYQWWHRYPLLNISDPFSTCSKLADGTAAHWTLAILLCAAVAACASNLRPLFHGISEVLGAPVRERRNSLADSLRPAPTEAL